MKKFRTVLLIVILGVATMTLNNCRRNPGIEETMAFSNVEYVKEFPVEIEAECSKEVDLGEDLLCAFTVCDSLMLCSTNESQKYIKVMSWPGMRPLKEFINKGNGPYELTSNLLYFEENVEKEGDDIYIYFYDQKKSIVKVNVSKSLKQETLAGEEVFKVVIGDPFIFYGFIVLEDDGFIISKIENGGKRINRYLYRNNGPTENEVLNRLNEIQIEASSIDFNVLGRHTAYHRPDKRIVEAYSNLNLINIYTLDGEFQKSICVGKKLDNLRDIESMPYNDRPSSRYIFLKGYEYYFAATYGFLTYKDLIDGKRANSEIHIFDWSGNPLCRIKLDRPFTTFHIDRDQNALVGMDVYGKMFFYDIDLSFL